MKGMLTCLKTSRTIVSLCVAKNSWEVVKPHTTKLQKRDPDICESYCMIDEVIDRLDQVRENVDTDFVDWFNEAEELAERLDTDIRIPRVTGRQTYRANVEVPAQKTTTARML